MKITIEADAKEVAALVERYKSGGSGIPLYWFANRTRGLTLWSIWAPVGNHHGMLNSIPRQVQKSQRHQRYCGISPEKVRTWIEAHGRPNPIAVNGKNYAVVYRKEG